MPEYRSAETVVVCPVSQWYFRRIGLIALLFAGLGLYFFYDGAIGYPRANFHADLFDAFEAGKTGAPFESLSLPLEESPKDREELRIAHQTGSQGGSWAAFAAARHLGEAKPERHSAGSIRQQFVFGWVLIGLTFLAGVHALIQRNRSLRAGEDWLETPTGRRIEFSLITGINFSKWDRGIAFLEIFQPDTDENSRLKLDDYRFDGAAEILRRIARHRPEIRTEAWPKSIATSAD